MKDMTRGLDERFVSAGGAALAEAGDDDPSFHFSSSVSGASAAGILRVVRALAAKDAISRERWDNKIHSVGGGERKASSQRERRDSERSGGSELLYYD